MPLPVSCPVDTGVCFTGGKVAGTWDWSLHLIPRLRIHEDIPPRLYTSSWNGTYLSTWTTLLIHYSGVLREKLIVVQQFKKFHSVYETQMIITFFTEARHWILSWATGIKCSLFQNLYSVLEQSEDSRSTLRYSLLRIMFLITIEYWG
jgi:hypothetical protein